MKPSLVAMILFLCAPVASACELCRDAVSTAGATISFNGSIYWMIGGVFVVMGLAGRSMVQAGRRPKS